jgi:hypothetical protein
MNQLFPIAIVGGGPAGAFAGELLAAGGRQVLLFDEKLAWEKPCGGGLTHKALVQYPFLGEARAEAKFIEHCELGSPSGRRVRFGLRYPLAIFSRFALNRLLLERARYAGVELRQERVTRISGTCGAWILTTPFFPGTVPVADRPAGSHGHGRLLHSWQQFAGADSVSERDQRIHLGLSSPRSPVGGHRGQDGRNHDRRVAAQA